MATEARPEALLPGTTIAGHRSPWYPREVGVTGPVLLTGGVATTGQAEMTITVDINPEAV